MNIQGRLLVPDPQLNRGKRAKDLHASCQFWFYLIALLLLGPLTVSVAWRWYKKQLTNYVFVNRFAVGGVFIFWTAILNLWRIDWQGVWWVEMMLWWWFLTTTLIPITSKVIQRAEAMMWNWAKRKSEDHLDIWQRRESERRQALGLELEHEMSSELPDAPAGYLAFGKIVEMVDGDLMRDGVFIRTLFNWVCLHESALLEHMLVIGKSGFGKTTLLLQMIHEILAWRKQGKGYDVFLIDGKGEMQFAKQVATLSFRATGNPMPIFMLDEGGSIYNPFAGNRQAVYDRLVAMLRLEEMTGPATYYAEDYKNILLLACGLTDPRIEEIAVPSSFGDLLSRINVERLKLLYADFPAFRQIIDDIPTETLRALRNRIMRWANILGPMTGEEGFSLEHSGGAVFSIPTGSYGETALDFMRLLIEDMKDFMRRRNRPAILFIDEFGMLGTENILALLKMARSHGIGVVLASQTVASLGENENIQQQILEGTGTKVLMRSDYPELVGQLGGTKLQYEYSYQHDGGEPTQKGSSRLQHAFKVDMNRARTLQKGEAYIIQGQVALVKIKAMDDIAILPNAVAAYPKHVPEIPVPTPPRSEARQAPKIKLRPPNSS